MTDIAKGVLGSSWALIVGWILPCALGMFIFGVVILPSLDDITILADVAAAKATDQAIVLLIGSVAAGLVLSALQTPLYRILEGYLLWPGRLKQYKQDRHRRRYAELRGQIDPDADSLQLALSIERLNRYPDHLQQFAPTLLGNGIRRFEYYAQDRYRMDSQLLWYQLRAVAPENLSKELDNARAGVDFFVCSFYVLLLLAVSGLTGLFITDSDQLRTSVTIALAISGTGLAYRSAVTATDSWAASMRALVDVGRLPLAKALGLTVPTTLAEERTMWQSLGWFLAFKYDDQAAAALDPFRSPSPSTDPAPSQNIKPDRKRRRRRLW